MAETDAKKEATDTSRPSDEEKVEMPEPTPPNSLVVKIDPSLEPPTTGSSSEEEEEEKKEEEKEANSGNLHAVIRMVQERDLGKAVIAFAIPIAMGIVASGKDKLAQSQMSIILILLCLGFTAIFNGILLKETFTLFAQIAEPVGIALIAIAFFAIVAFFLPTEISWVPLVCIALCLVPFGVAVFQAPPK